MNEWQRVRCFQCLVSRYSPSIWLETEVLRSHQKTTTIGIVLIIDGDVLKFLEAEENKTTQRKTQTEVAFVMTFRLYCGEQEHR